MQSHCFLTIHWLILQLKYNGKSVPLPFNLSILKWAAGTRKILNDAQLPNTVSFYNIFGKSYETPFDVWYVTVLLVSKQDENAIIIPMLLTVTLF